MTSALGGIGIYSVTAKARLVFSMLFLAGSISETEPVA